MISTPSTPRVSVVIVCWNSAAYLPHCLASLAAQSYRDFEVIIVDNGSTDGAAAGLAQQYHGLALRTERLESNRGFAAANNIGAHLARGHWLALLNPDAFPEPDWLEQLTGVAGNYPTAFFASRQIQADRPQLLDGEGDVYHVSGLAWRAHYGLPVLPAGEPREVFSACGAAAMLPRQAFLDSGGFDADYFAYHEDVDLGFRLRLRGLKCLYVPRAVVHHVGSASQGRLGNFVIYHGHRNLVWTFIKDMPAPLFWFYLPLHAAMSLFYLMSFSLQGRGRAIWQAKLDAVRGLPAALKKRSLIQRERRASVSALWRAMNRNLFGPLENWSARRHHLSP